MKYTCIWLSDRRQQSQLQSEKRGQFESSFTPADGDGLQDMATESRSIQKDTSSPHEVSGSQFDDAKPVPLSIYLPPFSYYVLYQ